MNLPIPIKFSCLRSQGTNAEYCSAGRGSTTSNRLERLHRHFNNFCESSCWVRKQGASSQKQMHGRCVSYLSTNIGLGTRERQHSEKMQNNTKSAVQNMLKMAHK